MQGEQLRYAHIWQYVTGNAWAILPDKMAEIMAFLHDRTANVDIDPALLAEYREVAAQNQARRTREQRARGVAVLPVLGTITHRAGIMSQFSGGTSVETLTRDFRAMVHDPDIDAIVLDVDSPGGSMDGLTELASEIYRARKTKPVTAVANTLMASGAYWLASQASEIVASPTALVGSIGVMAAHEDRSALLGKMGVNVSLISAGKYKTEGNPLGPLTDDARAHRQSVVDDGYKLFTADVARGRGVPVDTVRSGFGEGRVLTAKNAIAAGMVDRIASIDEIVATINRPTPTPQDAAIEPVASLTFEQEIDAVLTAAQSLQARYQSLTELRAGRKYPISQGSVSRTMEVRDALRDTASYLDGLIAACRSDAAGTVAMQQARVNLMRLRVALAELD